MSVDVEYIILMYLFICKLLSYPKCAFDELNVHCVFQTTDRKKFCSKFLSSVVTPNRRNRDRIFTQKKPNLVLLCVNKLNKCRLTFFLYCGLFTFTVRYSLQTEHCQSKALTGEPKPKSFPCSLHTKSTFDFLSDIVTNYATALCVCFCGILRQPRALYALICFTVEKLLLSKRNAMVEKLFPFHNIIRL